MGRRASPGSRFRTTIADRTVERDGRLHPSASQAPAPCDDCGARRVSRGGVVAVIFALALLSVASSSPTAAGQQLPTVTLSPTAGPAGSSLTAQGTNFPRRQAGQLYWAGSASGMPAFMTNGNGSFSLSLRAPTLSAGSYTVSAVVGGQSAGALFTILAPSSSGGSGVYLGVWQPGAPADLTKLTQFERDAGKQAAIVHWFQGWGAANAALDPNHLRTVAARGSVAMITWEPWNYTKGLNQPEYSLASIAGGAHDTYVRTWARALADYGGPVLLRFAHEMNLRHYPWSVGVNGNTAAQYIAAWRRLYGIFAAEGATNVQWIWSPNVAWTADTAFEPMFPGDAYVHWVALDGYNNVDWGGWQSFGQIFGPSYRAITALSTRPVMIAETSSGEKGGSKADWITDALARQIPTGYPRIKALIWFNESKEVDWRIQSSDPARRAFADAVKSTSYLATWP
jgi:hypothetical protein